MWSSRAEEVVSRLIAGLSPEQLGLQAATLAALPIGGSMWAGYYLRANGEVVVIGEDFDHPDAQSVYTDRLRVLSVLVWGAGRYPELRDLIPPREPGAADCRCRLHPEWFRPGKLICQECGGVGWLPANSASPPGGGLR